MTSRKLAQIKSLTRFLLVKKTGADSPTSTNYLEESLRPAVVNFFVESSSEKKEENQLNTIQGKLNKFIFIISNNWSS